MNLSLDLTTQDAIRFSVPLWLAGLGELVLERAGVVNIGIEGMMLVGAMAGWAGAIGSGSAMTGLLVAGLAGALLGVCFALVAIMGEADQVVTGTALNLVAFGIVGVGYKACLQAGWTTRPPVHFEPMSLKFLPFRAFDQFGLFYMTVFIAVALHVLIRKTRWGMELISLGEYPAALVATGARVHARRALIAIASGVLAGLAGAYLSIMFNQQFGPGMTAGRGYLALAMVIFGRWQPLGLLLGGLFFGYVYAIETGLEVSELPWLPAPRLLQMAPYLLTLLVLAGLAGRARSPAALGQSAGSR